MFTARTNGNVISYALSGQGARTSSGNMSTDNFRTGYPRNGAPYHGQLPRAWRVIIDEAFRAGRVSQVVYSYSTPIAWRDERYGWIIPVVTYSATTSSKHQSQLYRLRDGLRVAVPYDATSEDIQRVLDGLTLFTTDTRGRFTGTRPGPNYTEGE